jgi:SAM-dependent methyltransferase
MPTSQSPIEKHYARARLVEAIADALRATGRTPEGATVDDLAPVDEFHVGGRAATSELARRMTLTAHDHVLDIGCGPGGTARFLAARWGCRVTGIDRTADYVAAARVLTGWVGLDERLAFLQGDATSLPFPGRSFHAAIMLHVGMNVPDKEPLFREAARVLAQGGRFGIYDIMATGKGPVAFPVPWSTTEETSAVAPPETYRRALRNAGFEIAAERDRRDFALDALKAVGRPPGAGPPPPGIHLLMGADAREKIANMAAAIEAGAIAPVEIIAQRAR